MNYRDVLILGLVLLVWAFAMVLLVFIQKFRMAYRKKRNLEIQLLMTKRYLYFENVKITTTGWVYLENLFFLMQRVKLPETSIIEAYEYLNKTRMIGRLKKRLFSPYSYRRKQAISYLSLFRNKDTLSVLANRLNKEPRYHIRLMLVNGLKRDINQEILKKIVYSFPKSRRFYLNKAILIIRNHLNMEGIDLKVFFDSVHIEIIEFLSEIAKTFYIPEFQAYLSGLIKEVETYKVTPELSYLNQYPSRRIDFLYLRLLSAASGFYGYDMGTAKYLRDSNIEVVKVAADSLAKTATIENIHILMSHAELTNKDIVLSDAIIKICELKPELYNDVFNLFQQEKEKRKRYLLAAVLSKKIDYLLLAIQDDAELSNLLNAVIKSRYSANLINWLNSNKNHSMEKRILGLISNLAKSDPDFYMDLNNYLDPVIFKKLGYVSMKYPKPQEEMADADSGKFRWLLTILIIVFAIFPIIFIITNIGFIFRSSFFDSITKYLIDLNIWFIAYYVFINFTYIAFAFIALAEFKSQHSLWNIKDIDYLYEPGVMAPISIMVPAYNEELTIVESVRSLLSLEYPEFEVIVVNDGSKDGTLRTIIDAFDLKRIDYYHNDLINTNHVKAAYRNKFYPKLLVVDKENGGKADSLNVAINFSKFDYVCGIDADSILESDSMLKMMSTILDNDHVTLALGGSIVPVNGSEVDHGYVERFGLPKTFLTAAQSIEYIRAFNTGRLAFTRMRSLLIISGAFGLFEKKMLVRIGGYLAASSFKRKTVGEDMELVVRITREATEADLVHEVKYVPMARCYTEVPSDLNILLKQRNRWQRGLIETLYYHRKMIVNHHFGSRGLLGMPYFFFFEMIAPLLELEVYLSLIIGVVFGIFNGVYILALLAVTTLLGVVLSMTSLFVQEKYARPLSFKDTMLLVLMAIIENFGWRQFINLYRSIGFFSSLKGNNSWGAMTRTGFKK